MKVIAAWLGNTDIKIAQSGEINPVGPIAQALAAEKYDLLLLLANQPKKTCDEYISWLNDVAPTDVEVERAKITSPTNFSEIYETASQALKNLYKKYDERIELTLHLSPGTPAMSSIWIILGNTKFTARLIQSSPEKGIEPADVPFDISAEFIPHLTKSADQKRQADGIEKAPADASFGNIIYRSKEMDRVIINARKAALRNLPVLIEGESGTGKELLARAIHNDSLRANKPFIVLNCGAIPSGLIDSELFGHKKGSFTGADSDQIGAFEAANEGTLFLDEIGELPLSAQVNLLRPLQEMEIKRVGETKTRQVDVRIIAATNKNLISEVSNGGFREDLFYRLAIATMRLPPLREREGDLSLLADSLLKQVNDDAKNEPGYIAKRFSPAAKNLILRHTWPGNVRELLNTLRRVTLFSATERISKESMLESILPIAQDHILADSILGRDLSKGVDLKGVVDVVTKHYLKGAMKEAGQNKTKAAKILGLNNYQTLDHMLKKYEI
jgi:transcriptional regulator with PAS, ATPase and Fis domain